MEKIDFKGIEPGNMCNIVTLLVKFRTETKGHKIGYKTMAFCGWDEGISIEGGIHAQPYLTARITQPYLTARIRLDKVQVVASVAEKEFKYGYGSNNVRRLHGLKANRRVKRRDKRRVK